MYNEEPDHSLGGHMIAGLLEPMPGLHLFTLPPGFELRVWGLGVRFSV